jgi:hypothetical protein
MPPRRTLWRWLRWKPTTSRQSFVLAGTYLLGAATFPLIWVLTPGSVPDRGALAALYAAPFLGLAAWNVASGLDLRPIGH